MPHQQMTLSTESDRGFEKHRKLTRRDVFLSEMDRVVPWSELCALIEPVYPKARERGGRRPIGLERLLRIYFLQQWYDLSDPAVEEALYDSQAMRRFVGIDLGREAVPDETTVCKFCWKGTNVVEQPGRKRVGVCCLLFTGRREASLQRNQLVAALFVPQLRNA